MNYYEILKISRNASSEQIKDAYKKQVKKYHPDLYVGDKEFAEKKLKEINEAYKILSDSETKLEYDKYLDNKYQENIINTQTVTKTTQNYTKNRTYNTTQNYSNIQTPKWTLSDFIAKKISKLDSKQQLKIFILVLLFISILFFINLIEIKQYFDNTESIVTSQNETKNEASQTSNISTNEDSPVYQNSNFTDIDNIVYQFWQEYEKEFYNSNNI